MICRLAWAAVALVFSTSAFAHNFGCDGKPPPEEVKANCCGKADAHRVGPGTDYPITLIPGGYQITVRGHKHGWKDEETMESRDGCSWAWWQDGSSIEGCGPEGGTCVKVENPDVYFYCLSIWRGV